MCGVCTVRLKIAGTPYRLFLMVLLPKLKRVRAIPNRPTNTWNVIEADMVVFGAAIQPNVS